MDRLPGDRQQRRGKPFYCRSAASGSTPAKNFYPRAGTNNARVRLGMVARSGGATRWVEWDREKLSLSRPRRLEGSGRAALPAGAESSAAGRDLARGRSRLRRNPRAAAGKGCRLAESRFEADAGLAERRPRVSLDDGTQWRRGRSSCTRPMARSCVRSRRSISISTNSSISTKSDRSIVVAGGPDPRERHLFRFALDKPR